MEKKHTHEWPMERRFLQCQNVMYPTNIHHLQYLNSQSLLPLFFNTDLKQHPTFEETNEFFGV